MQYLLTARLFAAVGGVPDADDELLRAVAVHGVGDVEGERVVAAAVFADLRSVHPHGGVPVHGAEVQQQPAVARHGGRREGAVVPEALRVGDGALHSAELRLHRERHEDLAVPVRGLRGAAVGDGVVPLAVEVGPDRARELWARIVGPGALGGDVPEPAGADVGGRLGRRGGSRAEHRGRDQGGEGGTHTHTAPEYRSIGHPVTWTPPPDRGSGPGAAGCMPTRPAGRVGLSTPPVQLYLGSVNAAGYGFNGFNGCQRRIERRCSEGSRRGVPARPVAAGANDSHVRPPNGHLSRSVPIRSIRIHSRRCPLLPSSAFGGPSPPGAYPPAIAPITRYGSLPSTTSCGSGSSGDPYDRSSSHA